MLLIHFAVLPLCVAFWTVGTINEVMTPMTAVATRSSTMVKPADSLSDLDMFILLWGWLVVCAEKKCWVWKNRALKKSSEFGSVPLRNWIE
jgi:hypothetical protein